MMTFIRKIDRCGVCKMARRFRHYYSGQEPICQLAIDTNGDLLRIDPSLLEIHQYEEPAYRPLVDFASWRVAVLNYCDALLPERLHELQRHDETDEVFVLLRGRCILFLGDGQDEAGSIQAADMEPLKVYNVKRGTWHSHTLSPEAMVLVVENRDTTTDNSPFCPLTPEQTAKIVALTEACWPA